MSTMWCKRSVVAAIILAGAVGRLAGCATMGSTGKMMYEPPFVIAGSNEGPLVTTPTSGVAIDQNDRVLASG
jgi:hypothetical protein